MKPPDSIALEQIDRRMKLIGRAFSVSKVRPGWIRYTRLALGMTFKKLAQRAGVSIGTVAQAERREAHGKVTVDTLRKLADAMECEFVYAFVPKTKSVKSLLKVQAWKKAERVLDKADTHMTLEDQKVTTSRKARIEKIAKKLLDKGDVW